MEIVLPDKRDTVIAFRADSQLQARIEELARKSTEGQLADENGRSTRVSFAQTTSSPFLNGKPYVSAKSSRS